MLDKEVSLSHIIKRTNHEEKFKQTRVLNTMQRKKASLFAFQTPKAGNKQQFLERDMLNTLPVGYSFVKYPIQCLEMLAMTFFTICKPDTTLLN